MPRLSNLSPLELVGKWREIVNENTARNRDINLFTRALQTVSPIQLLHGMYQYKGHRTISVAGFLRREDDWIEDNEAVALIELATYVENVVPTDYYLWKEMQGVEDSRSFHISQEAFSRLSIWARSIIQ